MLEKNVNNIKNWLKKDFNNQENDKIRNSLIDILNPGPTFDKVLFDDHYNDICFIIHRFSQKPWTTQKFISDYLNIDKETLIKLNNLIRNNNILQEVILNQGAGRKYWKTIIPFAKRTNDVLEKNLEFPKRIAIFPGVSCMFYCGFCGRNQKAKYPTDILDESLKMYQNLFLQKSEDTAFSISGGLEPLTNPKLGSIIESAYKNNIRVPLITNGYALTDGFIKNNPGIWLLDSLRISLYGIDDETYDYITRSRKGYQMVKKNIINFLIKRNEKSPKMKVGFNFIILSENITYFEKILDTINEVNSKVKNGRGIDFVSLRDDYQSVTGQDKTTDLNRKYRLKGTMNNEERLILMKKIQGFVKRKNEMFENLHIDFGYSLENLVDGNVGEPLIQVNGAEMRKFGFPQLSVAIDLFGDVFLFREAGFLDREGNKKFIIGRISKDKTLQEVIKDFLNKNEPLNYSNNDSRFMDSFDHVLTVLVNQAESDKNFKIPFAYGPIKMRSENKKINLGNNWYSDQI